MVKKDLEQPYPGVDSNVTGIAPIVFHDYEMAQEINDTIGNCALLGAKNDFWQELHNLRQIYWDRDFSGPSADLLQAAKLAGVDPQVTTRATKDSRPLSSFSVNESSDGGCSKAGRTD
jgi:hypothetical protein